MGGKLTLAISLAISISSFGCSADSGVDEPLPDAAFPCTFPDDAGEPVDLRLGVQSAVGEFQELADGDSLSVILGLQGGLMTPLELRVPLPVSMDGVCLVCDYELTGVGNDFETVSGRDFSTFSETGPDQLGGSLTVIIGSSSIPVDGLEVEYSLTCEGHGVAATALRTLVLDYDES